MAQHAPKRPQDRDEDSGVVDLNRYRKTVQAQAEARRKAAAPGPGADEPLLGQRPGAGLILAGCLAVAGALWLLSVIN